MSAAEALKAARAVGIHLEVDGDDLLLEASAPPPSAILEVLSQHKAEIVALLRPGRDGWPVNAAISCAVHPASASRRAAALRRPWKTQ